jgi:hypothetical protein
MFKITVLNRFIYLTPLLLDPDIVFQSVAQNGAHGLTCFTMNYLNKQHFENAYLNETYALIG